MAMLSRILWLLCTVVLGVLVWNSLTYFNGIPEGNKNKPLLAWDIIMLMIMLGYSVVRLVIA